MWGAPALRNKLQQHDDSSESSLTDIEYEDHWARTREETIKDNDWESANKITAFPIMCKKNIKLSIPSSDDDSSESSLTDIEYEDHWARTREETIKDNDWESANKITAFPIMVVEAGKWQAERGTAPRNDSKYLAAADQPSDPAHRRPVPSRQKDPSVRGSPAAEEDDLYTQVQLGTRRKLVSDLSIQFEDDSIYKISTGKQAPLNGPFDILIIGDPLHKPSELAVIPEVQTLEPGEEIFVSVMCLDYPYLLAAGVPIAQAFLIPRNLPDIVPENPLVLWTQIMGTRKPIYLCTLFSKGNKIKRLGMMDTGADVTLLAKSEWPPDWELEPVSGFISGIGGVATSWRAKRNVVISGPEGKVATPGMPSPVMLPRNWPLAVIDIKDCFFGIPLHPADAPKFAFSVPSPNRQAPLQKYHWLVLPQGMKNSPSICQWYVAKILSPVRTAFPDAVILHYMDDVLVCAKDQTDLDQVFNATMDAIKAHGFEIQSDKVQLTSPWNYLGLRVHERTITPQQIAINANPKTLNEMQQLCGSINWVRPLLGISSEDLAPLFNLLRGDSAPNSPRSMTSEARAAVARVQEALSSHQAHSKLKDPLLILEWIFQHAQPHKTITTPQEIIAAVIRKAEELEFLLQHNDNLQFSLDSYPGKLSIHYPGHKLFKTNFNLIPKFVQSKIPLEAVTVFTDGSGSSHKSVMTWKDPRTQKWESDVRVVEGSPQIAELAAVVRAFEKFKDQPFNLNWKQSQNLPRNGNGSHDSHHLDACRNLDAPSDHIQGCLDC
ncbi:hypothetical protein HGM15179_012669 [Zosterops borbonicus]|uniref:ribonuclease H n=1 Tax=Zosterops borbonicus TaxID=364589 RepID=A0A8K1G9F1_9PASS|nr:hypothetical protein HGM15179_012669 [Zosterops borbonicus]